MGGFQLPQAGAARYSLYNHNCFWWAAEMIKNAGIDLPQSTYNEIRKYNFGVGIDGDGIDEYLFIRNTALVGMTVAGVAALTVGSFVTNYLIAHIAISIMLGF
jgi:hypothetical protein